MKKFIFVLIAMFITSGSVEAQTNRQRLLNAGFDSTQATELIKIFVEVSGPTVRTLRAEQQKTASDDAAFNLGLAHPELDSTLATAALKGADDKARTEWAREAAAKLSLSTSTVDSATVARVGQLMQIVVHQQDRIETVEEDVRVVKTWVPTLEVLRERHKKQLKKIAVPETLPGTTVTRH